jgi:hypothetical protein
MHFHDFVTCEYIKAKGRRKRRRATRDAAEKSLEALTTAGMNAFLFKIYTSHIPQYERLIHFLAVLFAQVFLIQTSET